MKISICQTVYGEDREPLHRRMVASAMAATLPPGWSLEWCLCRFDNEATPYLPDPQHIAYTVPPFSCGRGRNLAAIAAQGKVLAFIDADMLLPAGFWKAVCPIIERDPLALVCPKYERIMPDGSTVPGNGWGNLICRRALFDATTGYEMRTVWGGEDTAAIAALRKFGGQVYRVNVPGFLHQWHPKVGAWYDGAEVQP